MSPIILTIDSEEHSARTLGYPTFLWDWLDDSPSKYANSMIIRWGNSSVWFEKNKRIEFPHVFNPAKNISFNCHKNLALAKLSKVVKTPAIFLKEVPAGVKVIYRPTEHQGGYGFNVAVGPFPIKRGYYATEFIDTKNEVRVWFARNQVMAALRVPLKELGQTRTELCRSQWGYKYCSMPTGLKPQVLAAAKAVGLDFGAADILVKGDSYYFLELNSAPTVDAPSVRKFYQNEINKTFASFIKRQKQSC